MNQRKRNQSQREARRKYWGAHDRDAYECPDCGADSPLEVHHINGDPFYNALSNLVGLCHNCHRKRHTFEDTEERLEGMRYAFGAIGEDGHGDFANEEPAYIGCESAH